MSLAKSDTPPSDVVRPRRVITDESSIQATATVTCFAANCKLRVEHLHNLKDLVHCGAIKIVSAIAGETIVQVLNAVAETGSHLLALGLGLVGDGKSSRRISSSSKSKSSVAESESEGYVTVYALSLIHI